MNTVTVKKDGEEFYIYIGEELFSVVNDISDVGSEVESALSVEKEWTEKDEEDFENDMENLVNKLEGHQND